MIRGGLLRWIVITLQSLARQIVRVFAQRYSGDTRKRGKQNRRLSGSVNMARRKTWAGLIIAFSRTTARGRWLITRRVQAVWVSLKSALLKRTHESIGEFYFSVNIGSTINLLNIFYFPRLPPLKRISKYRSNFTSITLKKMLLLFNVYGRREILFKKGMSADEWSYFDFSRLGNPAPEEQEAGARAMYPQSCAVLGRAFSSFFVPSSPSKPLYQAVRRPSFTVKRI